MRTHAGVARAHEIVGVQSTLMMDIIAKHLRQTLSSSSGLTGRPSIPRLGGSYGLLRLLDARVRGHDEQKMRLRRTENSEKLT
jgi:hypothetical protein